MFKHIYSYHLHTFRYKTTKDFLLNPLRYTIDVAAIVKDTLKYSKCEYNESKQIYTVTLILRAYVQWLGIVFTPFAFSYFVTLQLGIKIDLVGGSCMI